MMERRRALTIPFKADKDNLVPWTAFASYKHKHCDSSHKNGTTLFEHVMLDMARRKPCLILTDVLKTKKGQAYMERIGQSCTLGNQGQVHMRTQRESGRCREEPLISRDLRTRNDKLKSVTPKSNQKTTSSPAQRSRVRRRSQNADDETDKEENKDIEEVIIGTDNGDDFKLAGVVGCGLSLSWEPAEDTGSCDEFSPARIKDRWSDPEKEVQNSLKRKRRDVSLECNGTSSPKRHRESVLRLTGEDGRDGGRASTRICLEESGEVDLDSLDRTIVQFTVGADDQKEVLVPFISPDLETGDFIGSPRGSLSVSQENTTTTGPSEPIVLSSDDEESRGVPQRCSQTVQTLVTVEDEAIQSEPSQESLDEQQEASDMQVLHLVVNLPASVAVPPISSMDYSFSTLHCGGYQAKANGDMMIFDQEINIPLTDADERLEVMVTLQRRELRRYSVWEQQDLEDREFTFQGSDEPFPVAVLLLFVSQTAAAAIKQDLCKLCFKPDGTKNTDKVSPFILLTLRNPLEGMEGAFLRSLLDIDCLNSLENEKSIDGADEISYLEDFQSPVLSLDESIELIRKSGRDSHLLSLLNLESTDPILDQDQDGSHSDTDRNTPPLIQLEVESQKETPSEQETVSEEGTATKLEEDQKEQELETPSEQKKEEPAPVYTVCHRRTKGSYHVSLFKPDSSWAKYKHQGQARRLIQFPPPPLKGGITVTMEDLQCLDSGHFLNDVIIDFYLKYLLQKASAAVAERSHIFSSFFYKQLTRRDNASEGVITDSCQRQRRHQRVKTWTRHVDIFKKDFLFVPVNQEAHWYLVVICFPGLEEPKSEVWTGSNGELQEQDVAKSPNVNTETPPSPPTSNHSECVSTQTEKPQEESTKDPAPGPVNCTERTYKKKTVCKRPCILIMDSLKLSLHERVFKLLREYLQSEWEVRRGSTRDFGPDQMQSSHCKVPLQDNSSDCGLYLLQYVESFLQDPVVHFDLPLQLQQWFPRQQVRRKRDDIRDLVLNLYRQQNLDGNR